MIEVAGVETKFGTPGRMVREGARGKGTTIPLKEDGTGAICDATAENDVRESKT